MTQTQLDRLRDCKRKAMEIKNELLDIWSEIENNAPMYSDEEVRDIQIVNTIGVSASDLVIVFQRHNKII